MNTLDSLGTLHRPAPLADMPRDRFGPQQVKTAGEHDQQQISAVRQPASLARRTTVRGGLAASLAMAHGSTVIGKNRKSK